MALTRVTPSGSPYWARTNTFSHYGGHTSKSEWAGVAALGGDTDLAAADFNRLATDAACTARTTPFCIISYTTRESTSLDPLVSYVALPTGIYAGVPYDGSDPPTGFPSVELSGTNSVVTLESSYNDPFGIAQSFAVTRAKPTLNDLTAGLMARIVSVSGNVISVVVLDESAAEQQDKMLTLEIW